MCPDQASGISNLAFTVCSVGEIFVLAIMVGILKGLKSDESTENNTKSFSVLIAFAGGIWGALKVSSESWFTILISQLHSAMCDTLVCS